MNKLLPSKKFIKVFGGIVLILGLIVLIGVVFNKKTVFETKKENTGQVIVVGDLIEKDSDKDGLQDWEEALWGTDKDKADTDGNGISDFEEIKRKKELLANSSPEDLTENTRTDKLTQEIIKIVSVLQSSGQLTPENQDQISDQIVDYIEKNGQLKVYTAADFDSQLGDQKSVNAYLKVLNESLLKTKLSEDEMVLAWEYEKTIDNNMLFELKSVSQKLKKEENVLAKINPPEQFLEIHVRFLNSITALANLYDGLAQYEIDPLIALSAYSKIGDIFTEQQDTIDAMISRIKEFQS